MPGASDGDDSGSSRRARKVSLGQGISAPYPSPSGAAATAKGKANRRTDSKPELRLRSALHRRGLRFRKDFLVRFEGGRTHPDIVFTRRRVAVFVDGCFWHSCPDHGTIPKSNADYWVPKLQANVDRDRRVDAALSSDGWTVIRAWEHEDVESVADLVEAAVRAPTS